MRRVSSLWGWVWVLVCPQCTAGIRNLFSRVLETEIKADLWFVSPQIDDFLFISSLVLLIVHTCP